MFACRLACWIAFLPKYRRMYLSDPNKMIGPRDHALMGALAQMPRTRVAYDEEVVLSHGAVLPSGGALFLTTHLPVNRVFLRYLAKSGRAVRVVTIASEIEVSNEAANLQAIYPDKTLFLKIRQALAAGELIYLTIDVHAMKKARPLVLYDGFGTTEQSKIWIQENAFVFAERLPSIYSTVFLFTQISSRGRIEVQLLPAPKAANAAMNAFCDALQNFVLMQRR